MVKFYLLRFILPQQRKLAFLTKAQVTNQRKYPFLEKGIAKNMVSENIHRQTFIQTSGQYNMTITLETLLPDVVISLVPDPVRCFLSRLLEALDQV